MGPRPEEPTPEDEESILVAKSIPLDGLGKASKSRTGNEINATGLCFDKSIFVHKKVMLAEELQGSGAHHYEEVSFKEVGHIVQKTSAYEVIITKRQMVKRKTSKQQITAVQPDLIF